VREGGRAVEEAERWSGEDERPCGKGVIGARGMGG
jgi:hypothetical protein